MKGKLFLACLAATCAASAPLIAADPPLNLKGPPAPIPPLIKIMTVTEGPSVTISLLGRHGHGTPHSCGCTHTGAGNINVDQPSPDVVVLTMTGVAVACGHPCKPSAAGIDFDLEQCFAVVFEKPDVKLARLTIEARVIGLLRSHCKGGGSAEQAKACASVTCGEAVLATLCVPPHAVAGGENLSVNCREGPVCVPIGPGKYTLHQVFHVAAAHAKALLPCKAASAEFAPDPALDPLWISYWEPFKGAQKKDFGFQVTLKVTSVDTPEQASNGNNKPAGAGEPQPEKLPSPKP